MNELDESINPYAPPASLASLGETPAEREGKTLWREGDWLVIHTAARLPRYCMVTGEPAAYAHPISQIWQPSWVYLLLFFGLLPYFILSPLVRQRIELTVPYSSTIQRRHRRFVQLGIVSMLVGAILAATFIVVALGQWMSAPQAVLLQFGIVLFLIGLQLASMSPIKLKIVKVDGPLIFVRDVHPTYLARVEDIC